MGHTDLMKDFKKSWKILKRFHSPLQLHSFFFLKYAIKSGFYRFNNEFEKILDKS
jgi:hypothetical protein